MCKTNIWWVRQAISVGYVARLYDSFSVEGIQTNVQSASVVCRMRVKGAISVTNCSHVVSFLLVAFGSYDIYVLNVYQSVIVEILAVLVLGDLFCAIR